MGGNFCYLKIREDEANFMNTGRIFLKFGGIVAHLLGIHSFIERIYKYYASHFGDEGQFLPSFSDMTRCLGNKLGRKKKHYLENKLLLISINFTPKTSLTVA